MQDGTTVLGDNAYPLHSHLLTPVADLTCAAKENYNCAHQYARVKIEYTVGILKARYCYYAHTCTDKSFTIQNKSEPSLRVLLNI